MLIVEAATGVDRKVLRPDLYGRRNNISGADDVAMARAQEYALLATLLVRAPDAKLLESSPVCAATRRRSVSRMPRSPRPPAKPRVERVEREYFNLFIGLGRGELLPYGSYYLTGFLHERPLARLRADLAPLGIERAEGNCEPEDHAATLCEIMAGMLGGSLPAPQGTDQQIFEKHLAPWIGRFFADLERAEAANLLPPSRHARPRVHRNRNGGVRAAVMRRRANDMPRRECDERARQHAKQDKVGRRDFLRALGAGAGVAATAAAPLATVAKADSENNDEKRKARYKETDHVKTFYRVNRYPG